jgi:hypothetical protein
MGPAGAARAADLGRRWAGAASPAGGRHDPDSKALACYDVPRGDAGGMLLRFVTGRPVAWLTGDFLAWVCDGLAAEGKRLVSE